MMQFKNLNQRTSAHNNKKKLWPENGNTFFRLSTVDNFLNTLVIFRNKILKQTLQVLD